VIRIRFVSAAVVVVLVGGFAFLLIAFSGEANSPDRASETPAIGALREVQSAEVRYRAIYGRYAATLSELVPPTGLIGKDLASGTKGGYKFVITATPTGYTINANPVAFDSSGRRTFFSDQSMAVHQNFGRDPASVSSPTLQ